MSAVLGTPADVIKTRMMNQQYINGRGELYLSSYDCLSKTVSCHLSANLGSRQSFLCCLQVKAEGVPALWKGFVPTWSRMVRALSSDWLVAERHSCVIFYCCVGAMVVDVLARL